MQQQQPSNRSVLTSANPHPPRSSVPLSLGLSPRIYKHVK